MHFLGANSLPAITRGASEDPRVPGAKRGLAASRFKICSHHNLKSSNRRLQTIDMTRLFTPACIESLFGFYRVKILQSAVHAVVILSVRLSVRTQSVRRGVARGWPGWPKPPKFPLRKIIRQKQLILFTTFTLHIKLHSEHQRRRNALNVLWYYKSTDLTP